MKCVIDLGHRCNNRCTFCSVAATRDASMDEATAAAHIDRAAALGCSMVVLSGGEPTIRPDLLRLASRVASRGLDLGLVTNGRMLAVPGLLDRLVARRLRQVQISVHGLGGDHDALVRADAFDQTWAGVVAAVGRVAVDVRCVVTAQSAPLRGLVERASAAGARVTLAPAEPEGGAEGVEPSGGARGVNPAGGARGVEPGEAARRIREAIEGTGALHAGVPLCLLPGLEACATDARARGVAYVADVRGLRALGDGRVQPAPCADCALRGRCPGLHPGDLARWGAGMLRPVRGERSNSYHLTPRGELTWPTGEPCPLLARGVDALDPLRQALLRDGGRLVLHETRTRDFAPDELRDVRERWGQLYLDASDKAAPDDFAADLRKLAPDPDCDGCALRALCPGSWRALEGDAFGPDDALVAELIGSLRGDVLDVGCGDGRYGDALAPLVTAGKVRYRGFDPDPARIGGLQERWPWAALEVGCAEDVALAPASLDHALVLRSWNHLADPRAVVARLVRALRPGGTLLVADNVAFGLLRTAAQAARAEAGPAVFEHWRNDGAVQAAARLAGLPLREILRREVGPATSNQWVLRWERTGDDV